MVGGQPGGTGYRDILASLAIGILMDAFLVRTLLVPATVALLGRWNWWPSAQGSKPMPCTRCSRWNMGWSVPMRPPSDKAWPWRGIGHRCQNEAF